MPSKKQSRMKPAPSDNDCKIRFGAVGAMALSSNTCIALVLSMIQGCSEITLHSDKEILITHSLGLHRISLSDVSEPVVITTRGVGFVVGADHAVFGIFREELVVFPDATKCRLLVFVKDPEEVSRVIDLLTKSDLPMNAMCIGRGD